MRQRIIDAASVAPDAVVAGWAAGYLHGVLLLGGSQQPVRLIVPPNRQVRRPGIVAMRLTLDAPDVVTRYGLPCTGRVRTAYDVLRLAPNLTEAVVVGDCMLGSGLTKKTVLTAYAAEHRGQRGVRQLKAALPLLDPAAASPPESRLRLLCREAGLPRLLVNVPLYDRAGNLLGVPDLLEPLCGLVIEYDGAYHRELRQHTLDNAREERFEAHGLTVVRVTALDMRNREATMVRLKRAHQRCQGQDTTGWVVGDRASLIE